MIKLYHGTNTTFNKVELDKYLPYKDFGRGLYLTTHRTQALARAKNKCNFKGGAPTILAYQFDEKELANLNVKYFEKPTEEWANFIFANRNMCMNI